MLALIFLIQVAVAGQCDKVIGLQCVLLITQQWEQYSCSVAENQNIVFNSYRFNQFLIQGTSCVLCLLLLVDFFLVFLSYAELSYYFKSMLNFNFKCMYTNSCCRTTQQLIVYKFGVPVILISQVLWNTSFASLEGSQPKAQLLCCTLKISITVIL